MAQLTIVRHLKTPHSNLVTTTITSSIVSIPSSPPSAKYAHYKRLKDVLKFTRRVITGFKSKDFTHDPSKVDQYLCAERECPCVGHFGRDCKDSTCPCTRHVLTLMCEWYPEQCPVERLDTYRGCKASGSLVDSSIHVCHRYCPFTVSDQKEGRCCSISGCFYEEMKLHAHDYTFKIDRDLIDPMPIMGDWDEDDPDGPMLAGDDGGDHREHPSSSETGNNHQQPSGSPRTNKTNETKARTTPTESRRRHKVFARTAWEAVNKDLTGTIDCLRWSILTAAKSVILRVMKSPRSLSEENVNLLATVASRYYVEYRLDQDRSHIKRTYTPGASNNLHPVAATSSNTGHRKASVSVKRNRRQPSSSSAELDQVPLLASSSSVVSSSSYGPIKARVDRGSIVDEDDNAPYNTTTSSSDRSTTQSNRKMFRYFVLAVIQGCLSKNSRFPPFDFMTKQAFKDMKKWSRVMNVSNRRVTKYCTSISQSVESEVIRPWQVGVHLNLGLPPEVLQWDDWINTVD